MGADVDVGVCAHDDNGEHDPVSQVACDLLPTECEYEDSDSIYISEHDQYASALESKLHWNDNILATKPKPLQESACWRGRENAGLASDGRALRIPTRKHQIVLL